MFDQSGTSVGRIDLDMGINQKGFSKQVKGIARNTEGKLNGAFKKLGGMIGAAFATKAIFDFSKAAIGLASDLDEVQNVVDVTFGEMANDINDWSKNVLQSFGLSELSAKTFSSTLGAMLKSSGISGRAVTDMSKKLTELTADVASFYNLEHETAFNKIRAGISGETEPLKQLGINLNVANLEAFALSEGITKSYQKMSQGEQILLRYNYLLKTTKDAQGDFARTSDSWANQTKLLNEQFKILKTTLGQGLINILTPSIRVLNSIIQRLQVAAEYFRAFTEMITGKTSEASSSSGNLSDSIIGVGDDAEEAGKKISKSLASFDQLNLLTQGTSDSLSDLSFDFNVPSFEDSLPGKEIDTSNLDKVGESIDGIKDKLQLVTKAFDTFFGPTIKEALGDVQPAFEELKETFKNLLTPEDTEANKKAVKDLFFEHIIPYSQEAIHTIGTVFTMLLDNVNMIFNGIKNAAAPAFQGMIEDGLPLLFDLQNGTLKVLNSLLENADAIFDKLWREVAQPAMETFSKIISDTLGISKENWDLYGEDIVNGLDTFFSNLGNSFNLLWDYFLEGVWTECLDDFNALWDEHLLGLIDEFEKTVGELARCALELYNEFVSPIINWLTQKLGPIFSEVWRLIISDIMSGIGRISDALGALMEMFRGALNIMTGTLTMDETQIAKGMALFKMGGSKLKEFMKGLIVNPDWADRIYDMGRSYGSNAAGAAYDMLAKMMGKVPHFANGSLVSAPTLAMVGDNRNARSDPEVISPLSKLQDMMDSSNQAVVSVLMLILEAIQSNSNDAVMEIDGVEFGRMAIRAINTYQRMIGKTALNI